ncbi:MAG: hypothetical protein QOF84_1806, partial [Streptomyces sp.]|nr:hypothetical protein [Streptomyces sp.]
LPDLHLAVEEHELRSRTAFMARHLVELPVRFTPRKPLGEQVPSPRTPTPAPAEMPPAQPEPAAASAAAPVPPQRRSWWGALTARFRRR